MATRGQAISLIYRVMNGTTPVLADALNHTLFWDSNGVTGPLSSPTIVDKGNGNYSVSIPGTLTDTPIGSLTGLSTTTGAVLYGVQVSFTDIDEIVDRVLDELIAGHLAAGSVGFTLNEAAAGHGVTQAQVAAHDTAPSAGYGSGDRVRDDAVATTVVANLDVPVSTREAEVDAAARAATDEAEHEETQGLIAAHDGTSGTALLNIGNAVTPASIRDAMRLDPSGTAPPVGSDSIDAKIFGSDVAANAATLQYNGTGILGDTYPARQDQLGNFVLSGSTAFQAPSSYVLTSGIQTSGTVANTATDNSVYHSHTDQLTAMDLYYEYLLGTKDRATVFNFRGYINSNGDDVFIQAYNWNTTNWDTIFNLAGQSGSDDVPFERPLLVNHTGTGADVGKVRIRFLNDGAHTTSSLNVDTALVGFTTTGLTQLEVANAVYNATMSGYTLAGSFGEGFNAILVDTSTTIPSLISDTEAAIIGHGDNVGLWGAVATIPATIDANIVQANGVAVTIGDFRATGFATPANVTDATNTIVTDVPAQITTDHGSGSYADTGPADVSGLATTAHLSAVQTATEGIPAAITADHGPGSYVDTGGADVSGLATTDQLNAATASTSAAINTAAGSVKLAADGLDAALWAGDSFLGSLDVIFATTSGIVSGAGSGVEVFKGKAGDTRATITVGVTGNRTTIGYDMT